MPSGYTFKGRVGAVYNDSGDDFDTFATVNRNTNIVGSAVVSAGTSTTFASVDLSTLVPTTATAVVIEITPQSSSGSNLITVTVTGDETANVQDYGVFQCHATTDSGGVKFPALILPLTTAQTMYYRVSGTNAQCNINPRGYLL